ncbi:hypothetical protein ScPMuIL_000733 [Solemya velum]
MTLYKYFTGTGDPQVLNGPSYLKFQNLNDVHPSHLEKKLTEEEQVCFSLILTYSEMYKKMEDAIKSIGGRMVATQKIIFIDLTATSAEKDFKLFTEHCQSIIEKTLHKFVVKKYVIQCELQKELIVKATREIPDLSRHEAWLFGTPNCYFWVVSSEKKMAKILPALKTIEDSLGSSNEKATSYTIKLKVIELCLFKEENFFSLLVNTIPGIHLKIQDQPPTITIEGRDDEVQKVRKSIETRQSKLMIKHIDCPMPVVQLLTTEEIKKYIDDSLRSNKMCCFWVPLIDRSQSVIEVHAYGNKMLDASVNHIQSLVVHDTPIQSKEVIKEIRQSVQWQTELADLCFKHKGKFMIDMKDDTFTVAGLPDVVEDCLGRWNKIARMFSSDMKTFGSCTIKLKVNELCLFKEEDLFSNLHNKFPEITFKIQDQPPTVTIEGRDEEVQNIQKLIESKQSKLMTKHINYATPVVQLFKTGEMKKYIDDSLRSNRMCCVWEPLLDRSVVEVHAFGSKMLDASVEHIQSSVVCDTAVQSNVVNKEIRRSTQWQTELAGLHTKHKGKFVVDMKDDTFTVTGPPDVVKDCLGRWNKIAQMLSSGTKSSCTKTLVMEREVFVFLSKCHQNELQELTDQRNVTIQKLEKTDKAGLMLKGEEKDVQQAEDYIKDLASGIKTRRHHIDDDGYCDPVRFFAFTKGKVLVTDTEAACKCCIKVEKYTEKTAKNPEERLQDKQEADPDYNQTRWTFRGSRKKSIAVQMSHCADTDADVHVKPFSAGSRSGTQQGIDPQISWWKGADGQKFVGFWCPVWNDGKNKEKDQMIRICDKVLREGSESGFTCLAISVSDAEKYSWKVQNFTKCWLVPVIHFLKADDTSDMRIIFCAADETVYRTLVGVVGESLEGSKDKIEFHQFKCRHRSGDSAKDGNQLKISVIKGELANQSVDCLVNTINPDLKLHLGVVSNSLLIAAGMELQKECTQRYPKGIKLGDIAVTAGYKLKCKHVFHGALDGWNSYQKRTLLKTMNKFIKSCLNETSQKGLTSIAFPALGSGNLGYPLKVVAEEMYRAVYEFQKENKHSSLTSVSFVIYPTNTETLKAFEVEDKKFQQTHAARSKPPGQAKRIDTSPTSGVRQTFSVGGTTIVVEDGDVTRATDDAIVLLWNEKNMKKDHVVFDRAGDWAKKDWEYKRNKNILKIYDVAISMSGNLPCSKIINVFVKKDSIKKAVEKALTQAEKSEHFKSLAFSLLIDDPFQPDEWASSVYDAIKDMKYSTISNIRLVIPGKTDMSAVISTLCQKTGTVLQKYEQAAPTTASSRPLVTTDTVKCCFLITGPDRAIQRAIEYLDQGFRTAREKTPQKTKDDLHTLDSPHDNEFSSMPSILSSQSTREKGSRTWDTKLALKRSLSSENQKSVSRAADVPARMNSLSEDKQLGAMKNGTAPAQNQVLQVQPPQKPVLVRTDQEECCVLLSNPQTLKKDENRLTTKIVECAQNNGKVVRPFIGDDETLFIFPSHQDAEQFTKESQKEGYNVSQLEPQIVVNVKEDINPGLLKEARARNEWNDLKKSIQSKSGITIVDSPDGNPVTMEGSKLQIEVAEDTIACYAKTLGVPVPKSSVNIVVNVKEDINPGLLKEARARNEWNDLKKSIQSKSGITIVDSPDGNPVTMEGSKLQIEVAEDTIACYAKTLGVPVPKSSVNVRLHRKNEDLVNPLDVCEIKHVSPSMYDTFIDLFSDTLRDFKTNNVKLKYLKHEHTLLIIAPESEISAAENSVTSKLKGQTNFTTEDVQILGEETEKVQDVLSGLVDMQDDVHYEYDAVKRIVTITGKEYEAVHKVKHRILLGVGRIKETGRRNRKFEETPVDDKKFDLPAPTGMKVPAKKVLNRKSPFPPSLCLVELTVYVYCDNILELPVDCIVNAANENLQHGGGVAWVIAKAAGPDFDKESFDYVRDHGNLPVGTSCATGAGCLHYKCVIHTVGPRWDDYVNKKKCLDDLHMACVSSLLEAEKQKMMSIAFPAISAGVFGVPKNKCAEQYAEAVLTFSKTTDVKTHVREIHFMDKDFGIVWDIENAFSRKFDNAAAAQSIKHDAGQTSASGYGSGSGTQTSNSGHRMMTRSKSNEPQDSYAGVVKQKSYPTTDVSNTRNTDDSSLTTNQKKYLQIVANQPDIKYPKCEQTTTKDGQLYSIFRLQENFDVHVYRGDILESNVAAIVCSESMDKQKQGVLSKKLSEKGGKAYLKAKEDEWTYANKSLAEVFISKAGGKLKCNRVIHVFVPFWSPDVIKSQFLDKISLCFRNVLKSTETPPVTTIAMPLLGAGREGSPIEACISAFINEVLAFSENLSKLPHLREIHIIDQNDGVIAVLANELSDHVHAERDRLNSDFIKREMNKNSLSEKDIPPNTPSLEQNNPEKVKESNSLNIKPGETANKKASGTSDKQMCAICTDEMTNPVKLKECQHKFCQECIASWFKQKPTCPSCGIVYGELKGDQPDGTMDTDTLSFRLPGETCNTLFITYHFSDGIQKENHPNPGKRFTGTTRRAFLPDNTEGRKVLELLKIAFKRKLIFTIGSSRTTGQNDVVTWNDIHHKTSVTTGPFSYPDSTYLQRVQEELAAKGVTEKDLKKV